MPRPVEETPGDDVMDQRRSLRIRTRFDALISAESTEGAGTLTEISYGGALLEATSIQPPVGTKIRLFIFVQPVAPFELHGHVARITETGFAVFYELFDPEVRQLVDNVQAVVRGPDAR